jgi:hypothetical protein
VKEKLAPLQAFLDLNAAELKKIVLLIPPVLGYNHNNWVKEKLAPLQAFLGLNAAELKTVVLGLPPAVLPGLELREQRQARARPAAGAPGPGCCEA